MPQFAEATSTEMEKTEVPSRNWKHLLPLPLNCCVVWRSMCKTCLWMLVCKPRKEVVLLLFFPVQSKFVRQGSTFIRGQVKEHWSRGVYIMELDYESGIAGWSWTAITPIHGHSQLTPRYMIQSLWACWQWVSSTRPTPTLICLLSTMLLCTPTFSWRLSTSKQGHPYDRDLRHIECVVKDMTAEARIVVFYGWIRPDISANILRRFLTSGRVPLNNWVKNMQFLNPRHCEVRNGIHWIFHATNNECTVVIAIFYDANLHEIFKHSDYFSWKS